MAFRGHIYVNNPDARTEEAWYTYFCSYCNTSTSGAVIGIYPADSPAPIRWLCCTSCGMGSVCHWNGTIVPAALLGFDLEGLPPDVQEAYTEARSCFSVNAFTACELICRKILMHVAADKGAGEGLNFVAYINYLTTSGYITPPMRGWVDLIRQHGNQSTHELDAPDNHRAAGTLMFTAELLRLIYEMEHHASKFAPTAPPTRSTP